MRNYRKWIGRKLRASQFRLRRGNVLCKRFSSFEGLESRAMLSGDPVGSSGLYSGLNADDPFATPLSELSLANYLASNLGSSAPTASPQAASNDNGPTVSPLTAEEAAAVTIRLEDLSGNQISSVNVGQDFKMKIFVDDLRTESDVKEGGTGDNLLGVFSAYVKANFDTTKISLINAGSLTIDPFFTLLPLKNTATAGEITAGASTVNVVKLDGAPQLLWTVTLRATASGTASFGTAFVADQEFLLYGTNDPPLTADKLTFNGASLNVLGAPALSIGDVTQAEGNSGTTNFLFTVTRSGDTSAQATVLYSTSAGTATAGTDFTATSGTLAFAAGATSQIITVAVTGDTVSEPDEAFTVTLSGATGASISDETGLGTITNDDTSLLDIAGVSQLEGDANTTMVFAVTLSNAGTAEIVVPYTTADGTALAGQDYNATSGTLTFAAGSTSSQFITVTILGDTVLEANETFSINLTEPANAEFGASAGTAIGTITNDDGPRISISNPTISAAEGNSGDTNFVYTLTLTNATVTASTVVFNTTAGTATAGQDFTAASGTLTFNTDVTSQTVTIKVTGDTLNELDETFTLNLSSPTNASLEQTSALATIVNDDAMPSVSVTAPSPVAEGNSGTTPMVFTVSLSAVSGQQVTVAYATGGGSATGGTGTGAGIDYQSASGTLTFAPGATTQLVTVLINGDTKFEADETFSLTLSGPTNATLATASSATGTIADDGDPLPTVTVNAISKNEGNSGTTSFVFTATLSSVSDTPVTVLYNTSPGTAGTPGDYTASSGTISFAAGATTALVTVGVVGDTTSEVDETFTLNLSGPVGATLPSSTALATIINDDGVPSVTIGGAAQNEGNSGQTPLVFTVTLSAASSQEVLVTYATSNGTATAGSDYTATSGTLTFAAGATTALLTVQATGDTTNEANETFSVNLTGATRATVGSPASGTGTITNDDGPPSLSISDVTGNEGDTGTTNFVFTVTLSAASSSQITVRYNTANGTAIAGSDYTATSGTLTFAAGETSKLVTVAVLGDTLVEPNETFNVVLSTVSSGATILDATGVGTIVSESSDSVTVTPSTLTGKAFFDNDLSGVRNGKEKAIVGMSVFLNGTSTTSGAVTKQTTTGSDGSYAFSDILPGTYTVTFSLSSNYYDGIMDIGNQGGTALTNTEGFTITIASPGGLSASGYDLRTKGYKDVAISQRLFITSELGNGATVGDVIVDITSVTNPINNSNKANTTASGTGTVGASVSVVASNGSSVTSAVTGTVGATGTWTVSGIDVTSLGDGTITYTATITGSGSSTDQDTITSTKGTIDPTVAITFVTNPINASNAGSTSIIGSGTIGATVSVVVTDGTNSTPARTAVVGQLGLWTVDTLSVAALNNGVITYNVTITDATGNTATTSVQAPKDAQAPVLDIAAVTSPINAGNKSTVSINGTATAGTLLSIVAGDGTSSTTPRTLTVGDNGSWVINDFDVTSLNDGTITFVVTGTDAANNSTQKSITSSKDTVIPTVAITTLVDVINAAGDENVTIGGTGLAGASLSIVASNGAVLLPAVTGTIDANGNWSVSDINVSSLADGTITFTVTVKDAANNSSNATDTAQKDTVAPALAVTAPTAPINAAGDENMSVSGTGEVGVTVSVVVTIGLNSSTAKTAVVDAQGNWTVTGIDISGLADGSFTITATTTDAAGNPATATAQGTKDTVAPTVAITEITNPIGIATVEAVVISGTGEAGATVSLVATDGTTSTTPVTVVVGINGTWVFSGATALDVSGLDDGTITFTATVSDAAGNTGTDSDTTTKTTLMVLNFTNPVNADNDNNAAINGTAAALTSITVVVAGGAETATFNTTTNGSGAWSFNEMNLTDLPDGPITYTVTVSDGTNSFQKVVNATKDTVAPTVAILDVTDPINAAEAAVATIGGTGEAGASLSIVVTDGTTTLPAVQATVDSQGNWSTIIDVSSLADGQLTFTVIATDLAGNDSAPAATTANKDTVAPALSVTAHTEIINAANVAAAAISGTTDVGLTVKLIVTDGAHSTPQVTVVAGAGGTWSFSNLDVSGLDDGPLTYQVSVLDAAGNSAMANPTATMDTLAPPVGITTVTNPITSGNVMTTSISGTGENGAQVVVAITDGTDTLTLPAVTIANGVWSITGANVTTLDDGTLTFNVTATDAAGNTTTASIEAEKDSTPPQVAITSLPETINAETDNTVLISGTAEVGASVTVTAGDGTSTTAPQVVTVGAGGTWQFTVNVSGLNDATITFTVVATDAALNETTVTDTAAKDTIAPTVAFSELLNPVGLGNHAAYSISGTGEAGNSLALVVTLGVQSLNFTGTVDSEGHWTISGMDLSSLGDGALGFTVTATDAAGNTGQDTAQIEKATLTFEFTQIIGSGNAATLTFGGTGQVGATVKLTISDGVHPIITLNTTIAGNGTWSFTGVDVTGLNDGELSLTASAPADAASKVIALTAQKDTVAPDLAISSFDDPVNLVNVTEATITGISSPGATIEVTVSDGVTTTPVTSMQASGAGAWSLTINLSALADGPITYTVKATDNANNLTTDSVGATKDTVAPAVTLGSVTDPINSDNAANTTATGTGEAGASISIVAGDGVAFSLAVTGTVELGGNWALNGINVSSLADGTITYTVTITDAAGNTATATLTATKDTSAEPLVAFMSGEDDGTLDLMASPQGDADNGALDAALALEGDWLPDSV